MSRFKITRRVTTLGLVFLSSSIVVAQPPEGRRSDGPSSERRSGPDRGGPERDGPGGFRPGGSRPGGPGANMDPGRIMQMLPILKALDTDGDGELSENEMKTATASLMKLDRNNDGIVDRAEMRPDFTAMRDGARDGQRPQSRPRDGDRGNRGEGDRGEGREGQTRGEGDSMGQRLMKLDANGDGELSKEELENLPERAKGMMKWVDRDNSGTISKEELQQMGQRRGAGERDTPRERGDAGDRGGRREGGRPRGESNDEV